MKSIFIFFIILLFTSCELAPMTKELIERNNEVGEFTPYEISDSIRRIHIKNKDKNCNNCHKTI